jgi:hypothetical protein
MSLEAGFTAASDSVFEDVSQSAHIVISYVTMGAVNVPFLAATGAAFAEGVAGAAGAGALPPAAGAAADLPAAAASPLRPTTCGVRRQANASMSASKEVGSRVLVAPSSPSTAAEIVRFFEKKSPHRPGITRRSVPWQAGEERFLLLQHLQQHLCPLPCHRCPPPRAWNRLIRLRN